jgi:hypothetical protein
MPVAWITGHSATWPADGRRSIDAGFRRQRSPVINSGEWLRYVHSVARAAQVGLAAQACPRPAQLGETGGPDYASSGSASAPDLLDRLLRWKAAQHERTETRDEFRPPWARDMLERMLGPTRGGLFRSRRGALMRATSLVAGAVNLISGSTLHVWITAYNPEFAKFSPGAHCMVELIRAASAGRESVAVDLGHGEEPYKYRLCTEIDEVAEGCVDRRWLLGWSHRGRYEVRRRVLDSPLRPVAAAAGRNACAVGRPGGVLDTRRRTLDSSETTKGRR